VSKGEAKILFNTPYMCLKVRQKFLGGK